MGAVWGRGGGGTRGLWGRGSSPRFCRPEGSFFLPQKFACNGTVIEHPEYGEVIQLQGDQRKNICQFLVEVWLHC